MHTLQGSRLSVFPMSFRLTSVPSFFAVRRTRLRVAGGVAVISAGIVMLENL